MRYVYYCTMLIFSVAHFIMGMEKLTPQKINIPFDLAMQCQTIKNMYHDINTNTDTDIKVMPEIALKKNTNATDALLLISYIKKIQRINKSHEPEIKENLINPFFQDLSTLNTPSLVQLTDNIDYLNVIDENNHSCLIDALTKRICATTNDEKQFAHFKSIENIALMRIVKKKIAQQEKLDAAFIQHYSDTLTKTTPFPRTESLWNSSCTKIYNLFSWDTIRYKPYYYNTQTGTIIKSTEIIDNYGNTIKINSLCIFKKNCLPVTINTPNIKEITHISANEDETLFICQSNKPDKSKLNYFVINLNNKNNNNDQLQFYSACAFGQTKEELYISNEKYGFGILNTTTNQFIPTDYLDDYQLHVKKIVTNKKKTTIALLIGSSRILIGHNVKTAPLVFKPLTLQKYPINTLLTNICLCPDEDKICIIKFKGSQYTLSIIDISSLSENIYMIKNIICSDTITFLSKNILFVGDTNFLEKDYYFNIETGNSWTKKKQYTFGKSLGFTTDGMQKIETDREYSEKAISKIALNQTVDNTIINTINIFNNGEYPLYALSLTQKTGIIALNDTDYIHYNTTLNKELKTVFDSSHTITNLSLLSHIGGFLRHIYPTVVHWAQMTVFCTLIIIGAITFTMLSKRIDPKNTIKSDDITALVKVLTWLIS